MTFNITNEKRDKNSIFNQAGLQICSSDLEKIGLFLGSQGELAEYTHDMQAFTGYGILVLQSIAIDVTKLEAERGKWSGTL